MTDDQQPTALLGQRLPGILRASAIITAVTLAIDLSGAEICKRFCGWWADAVKFNAGVQYTFLLYRDRLFQGGNLQELASIPARKVLERGIMDAEVPALCRSLRVIIDDIRQAKRVWFLTTFIWKAYKRYQKVLPLLGEVEILLGEPSRGLILLKPDQAAPALDCSRFEAKEGK